MEPVRWGILSTARINHAVLEPARGTDKAEVIAVASRDAGRAQRYAEEQGIECAYAPGAVGRARPGQDDRGSLPFSASGTPELP